MTLVLLVDDDANLLAALKALISGAGYRVQTAVDGVDAMRAVTNEKPDVVVSDSMMPRMDGAGFVRALKAIPALAAIPIVMMSAAACPTALPLHAFLPKPFPAVKLLEVLQDAHAP